MRPFRPLRRLGRIALAIALIGAAFAVRAEDSPSPAEPSRRIALRGPLDRQEAARVARRIDRIVADGATSLMLDLDRASCTPEVALDLAERIHALADVKTVACVTGRALGGAAVIALACDELRVTPSALVGAIDCGTDAAARSSVAAAIRRFRPPEFGALLSAMVDPGLEIHRIRYGDGTVRLVEAPGLATALGEAGAHDGVAVQDRLVREDELLTLTAEMAVALRVASALVADADAVALSLGIAVRSPAVAETEKPVKLGDWTPPVCKKAAIILLDDKIGAGLEARLRRRVEEILADGSYDLLVIETDSPGGIVYHSMLLGDLIFDAGTKLHTVAWVPRKAISGAALTSFAAEDIVLGPAGTIGDCQPIVATADGYEALGEKIQSPLRAVFRKYAQRNGYPIAIAESMVSQDIEVLRVLTEDGTPRYFKRSEWDELDPGEQATFSEPVIIVRKDELPTFTASEAKANHLARAVAEDRDAMLALYGVTPENAVVFEITWSEEISSWLLRFKGILFLVGLIALYLEFKAPGFGAAGIVGIAAFALYFFAGTIGGVADSIEIVMFVAGIALLFVEIFITPGFGIPGIAGVLLLVVSLYLASTPFVVPDSPLARGFLLDWLLQFGGALVGTTIFAVAAARFLPNVPLFRRLMLVPSIDAAADQAAGARAGNAARDLVGRRGTATSDLRPAGRAEVDGRRLDVVTQGSFVDAGAAIEIVRVQSNRIIVRPVKDEKPAGPTGGRRDYDY